MCEGTKITLEELKLAHVNAVKLGLDTVSIRDTVFDTKYLGYLIQHLENNGYLGANIHLMNNNIVDD